MINTVFVLSIRPRDDEVLQSLCASIKSHGLEPVVIPGVVGRELIVGAYFDHAQENLLIRKRRLMSPGEVGCTLGHLGIWKAIADGPMDVGVVLEDDALLDSQFGARLALLIDFCKQNDCFVSLGGQENLLGFVRRLVGRKVERLPDTWELRSEELHKLFSSVGYVVSKATADRLIAAATKALFVADDYEYLHEVGAITRILISNVVGHPWGDHHSALEQERKVLGRLKYTEPRPLVKRLAAEIMATLSYRLASKKHLEIPEGYERLEWKSRFRK